MTLGTLNVARTDRKFAIHGIPVAGGADTTILPIDDVFLTPSWVVDETSLYYTPPCDRAQASSCALSRVAKTGGASQTLTPVSASALVRAVDATGVYVSDGRTIWNAPKAGGAPTQIFDAGTAFIGDKLVVDDTNVYFFLGANVVSMPKSGGATTPIGFGPQFATEITSMLQDEKNLFFISKHGIGVDSIDEILMLPKTPIAAAAQ